MTALFVVVPLALLVSALAALAFAWSVKHGQLDDLKTPCLRMLGDDADSEPEQAVDGTVGNLSESLSSATLDSRGDS